MELERRNYVLEGELEGWRQGGQGQGDCGILEEEN